MTQPKEIATLPPIEELRRDVVPSPRTGEPRRPWTVFLAAAFGYLALAAVGVSYGIHWWDAVHPESSADSANLLQWVKPEPGKWLSLTLEGAIALAAVVAGGAPAIAGFQAWNGWRWSRWAGLAAVVLTGGWTAIMNNAAFVALGLAVVSAALIFVPPTPRYFSEWAQVRAARPEQYRRPEWIFYGRLPRFR